MKRLLVTFVALTVIAAAAASSVLAAEKNEINLYSSSKEHLIRPLLDAFEADSAIKVNVTTLGGAQLVSRLALEGQDTPADAVMIADVARLSDLQGKGLLAPVKSEAIEAVIPANLRASDASWVGIATRARIVFRRSDDAQINVTDYRELADEKWRGQILIRSSSNPYNQSLMADLLVRFGEEEARKWAQAIVANMARKPAGGDRDQLRALASGQGRLAVANSYYYAKMLSGDEQSDKALAQKLTPMFPEATPKGATHVNIRGAGLVKASQKEAQVKQFLEFLVSDKAQKMLTKMNKEYPANPNIAADALLQSWEVLPKAQVPVEQIGARNADAIRVFGDAKWH